MVIDRKKLHDKSITLFVMLSIIIILFVISYIFFLQENKIDVIKDIVISYQGESGRAKIEVKGADFNYNQRLQEFMDSIEYEAKPNENLENGDVVVIKAKYDAKLANQYHIKVINTKKSIVVRDLPMRINKVKNIPYKFLLTLNELAQGYLQKHQEEILYKDFTQFDSNEQVLMHDTKLVNRLLLKANQKKDDDCIVDVYEIKALGNLRVSDSSNSRVESHIYYLVIYDGVNTKYSINEGNVYGEKLMIDEKLVLDSEKKVLKVINKKFKNRYQVEVIY